MMALGRKAVLPVQALIGKPTLDDEDESTDVDDYLSRLQTNMLKVHDVARANLGKAAIYPKGYYDTHGRRAQMRHLEAGQLVWLCEPTRKVGVCHKLISGRVPTSLLGSSMTLCT